MVVFVKSNTWCIMFFYGDSMKQKNLPVVGLVCDKEIIGPHPFHVTGDKYIQAALSSSGCLPLLIPSLGDTALVEQILSIVDGILLPGGYSMVDPQNYQAEKADTNTKLDVDRDTTCIPLIIEAVKQGVPILGICRGFQEMNVAFGGSLHQKLHEIDGYLEHRENKEYSTAQQYQSSHTIRLADEGKLIKILQKNKIEVNSLHTQGVDHLADCLMIEAVADDGLVEAFSVKNSKSFAMAVQWHPEWMVQQNEHSVKLFDAFGQACAAKKAVKEASLSNE